MSGTEAASRAAQAERFVDHTAWREALAQVRAALTQPHPVIAVLGPPGTGKTWLLRALRDELRAAGQNAVLLARGDAAAGPAPGSGPGVVLVDEADRIDPATLQALTDAGARGLVLAALPASAGRLEAIPGMVVVASRALRPEEAASFVRARLAAACVPDRLTPGAVAEIVANGRGIPRLLAAVTTAAEFVATLEASAEVTAAHVQEAVLLRGDAGAASDVEASSGPAPVLPAVKLTETGSNIHPDPDERWAESAAAAVPEPPRRRRAGLLAALACAAAALFVTYAATQPAGERLGRRAAALLPGRVAPAPASADAVAAPPAVAVEVASNQATGVAPAVATQGPAAPGLPSGVLPHVVLSYWQGDPAAERRASEIARTLRAAGIAANDPVPVLQRIAEPGIAYFFAEDRAGAAEIGRALGGTYGEGRSASLQQDEPLPRPGTIELQVASDQPETAERAQ
jgi:hypothetical protein